MKKIDVASGIRQGCTISSVLFKLITYMIMNELNQKGHGYKDENLFALKYKKFGLEIYREKSNILIFNMKEQPDELRKRP